MNFKTSISLIVLVFFYSCQFAQDHMPQEAENCPDAYTPPDMVPGTACANPCAYGYRGTMDFSTGSLIIDCEPSDRLKVYVDTVNLFDRNQKPIRAITIEAHQQYGFIIGLFCSHDFLIVDETSGYIDFKPIFRENPTTKTSRIHLLPENEYWDLFDNNRFSFQVSTKRPLSELKN